jgi:diaminohydroxyphosphoribosylaminopyrimidine deaminase/5-amino-6-(5-phosphoribosylamino)uracil reductase
MAEALALAARARGRTAPNPMVGAVLVREGRVVGAGFHARAGQPHAEVEALADARGAAAGATLYVNLEPCCHHGRTPPCTEAVIAAGIRRVVVGMVDPDPRMQGRGIAQLRAAGLEVEVGVLEAEALALNAGFVRARTAGRPQVILKAGVSLDGRIADAAGRSQWITGAAARAAGRALRDQCDAVLVGSQTVLDDDPALTTRIDGGRDALPVILDGRLRTPATAQVLRAGRPPLIFTAPDADPAHEQALAPARLRRVPRGPGGLELRAVLTALVDEGVHTLLVEGGGAVHHSLLSAGLVDELRLFLAPRVLAGGRHWVEGAPFSLADGPRFELAELRRHGDDLELRYLPAAPGLT